jgi:hypothetical protein
MRYNFLRDAKVSKFELSFDVQIWPLSFAPCLTQLFVPPCTDPSTWPHIQVSDVLVTWFADSNPAEGRQNPQHAFLRRGSKTVGPMS